MHKKYITVLFLIFLMLTIFSACNKNTDLQSSDTSEEFASLIADTEIDNSSKADRISDLTKTELERANDYKGKIKNVYQETASEFSVGYENIDFSLDSAYQSVDDYCEYLENEFSENLEFFRNLTAIKYHTGSAGAIFLATKEYECAKSYADKLENLYNDLV